MAQLQDGTQYDPGSDATPFDQLTPEKQAIRRGTSTSGSLISDTSDLHDEADKLGNDITKGLSQYGITDPADTISDTVTSDAAEIEARREALRKRNEEDKTRIDTEFDTVGDELKISQEDEIAKAEGRTRIGGFLTRMEVDDINDLRRKHRLETIALEGKHQDALRQAQRAYEDGDYQLARDKVAEAKDIESEKYKRRQDYFNNVIQYAGLQKSQTTKEDTALKSWTDYKNTAITNGAKVELVKKAEALRAEGKEDEARSLLSSYTGTKGNQVIGYDGDGNPIYSSAPGGTGNKLLTSFNNTLASWAASAMRTETREQFIKRLQAQYGYSYSNPNGINNDDIVRKVYEVYPDGYDSKLNSSSSELPQ